MTRKQSNLRDVEIEEAFKLYMTEKERECSPETVYSHRSRLGHFKEWFQTQTDYDYLRELDGYDLKLFEGWRYGDDYSNVTIATQQTTLRVFLRFCSELEAVPRSLAEKVKKPDAGGQRDNEIKHGRATRILEHLDKYKYSSHQHVSTHLMWYSMMRVGSLHSLDVDDVDLEDGYLEIRHRPEEGTRLKNAEDGERIISIRPETVALLSDYLENTRHEVRDDYGREPLITSQHGRPNKKTIRSWTYSITCPCLIGGCPHDRNPDECNAANNMNLAHECPSSESTHALRRGSISWHLRQGTGKSIVGDRADVSTRVLEKHYSTLTEREKADVRREKLPDG